jgi:7-keto-8-aminopelargonate synthetase-like enzyme
LIDDAHGFGTLGENGWGTLEYCISRSQAPPGNALPARLRLANVRANADANNEGPGVFVGGTLSKALGGYGGILASSAAFIELAKKASHYFDGASAPPSPVAGASAKALEIVLQEPQLRKRLQANVAHLRRGLKEIGLPVEETPSPIIGLRVGDAENMRRIHRELKAVGILLPYSTYSGAGKEGILRIAVFATHTAEMLDRLIGELRRIA